MIHADPNSNGTISSLNFPDSFPRGLEETLTIRAPIGSIIYLELATITLPYQANCSESYIMIREELLDGGTGTTLYQFCPESIAMPRTFMSKLHRITLRVRSEEWRSPSEVTLSALYSIQSGKHQVTFYLFSAKIADNFTNGQIK